MYIVFKEQFLRLFVGNPPKSNFPFRQEWVHRAVVMVRTKKGQMWEVEAV